MNGEEQGESTLKGKLIMMSNLNYSDVDGEKELIWCKSYVVGAMWG